MGEYLPSPEEIAAFEFAESPAVERQDLQQLGVVQAPDGTIKLAPGQLEIGGTTRQAGPASERHVQAAELWANATLHRLSVVAKLRETGRDDLARPLATCHTDETCRVCSSCRRVTVFYNRCERHYCPSCAPRLARERKQSVEWWTKEVNEPKHVVLTVRNTDTLTKAHVLWFKQNWTRLRHRRFARGWRGGLYRLEVTNERKGWHLHLHALIDAGWIDKQKLNEEWSSLIGQAFAIVDVRDVHNRSYLTEVTKYTVKGSQLAGWTGEQIAEFVDAFDGVKTFGVFGTLYGKRTQWAEWITSIQGEPPTCICGCQHFRILSPNELAWDNLQRESRLRSNLAQPPPVQDDLPDLPPVDSASPNLLAMAR